MWLPTPIVTGVACTVSTFSVKTVHELCTVYTVTSQGTMQWSGSCFRHSSISLLPPSAHLPTCLDPNSLPVFHCVSLLFFFAAGPGLLFRRWERESRRAKRRRKAEVCEPWADGYCGSHRMQWRWIETNSATVLQMTDKARQTNCTRAKTYKRGLPLFISIFCKFVCSVTHVHHIHLSFFFSKKNFNLLNALNFSPCDVGRWGGPALLHNTVFIICCKFQSNGTFMF